MEAPGETPRSRLCSSLGSTVFYFFHCGSCVLTRGQVCETGPLSRLEGRLRVIDPETVIGPVTATPHAIVTEGRPGHREWASYAFSSPRWRWRARPHSCTLAAELPVGDYTCESVKTQRPTVTTMDYTVIVCDQSARKRSIRRLSIRRAVATQIRHVECLWKERDSLETLCPSSRRTRSGVRTGPA
jgi:hypothetical protein